MSGELLLVDDDPMLLQWARRVIEGRGYSCDAACDPAAARSEMQRGAYKLIVLDLNLPGESGLQLLSHIRSEHPDTAVLMLTGQDSAELALTAIEQGAYGYLLKPVGAGELVINVVSALHRRRVEIESRRLLSRLRETAEERSRRLQAALRELRESESAVAASDTETIDRLTRLMEMHDGETGRHLQRMSNLCALLAGRCGLPAAEVQRIRLASRLHDIGKVAIPESILLKRGKLTAEEMETIKTHARAGHDMLAGSTSKLLQLGARIALTHHERYDGTGYPRGLSGEKIPLEGRIAAIADVFDALRSDRVYRAALPVASAVEMMRRQRGLHFDPRLLDIFMDALPEIHATREAHSE